MDENTNGKSQGKKRNGNRHHQRYGKNRGSHNSDKRKERVAPKEETIDGAAEAILDSSVTVEEAAKKPFAPFQAKNPVMDSADDDEIISLTPDELEEIENTKELLYVDGADDIDLMAEDDLGVTVSAGESVKYEVIGVKFGSAAKTYYFDPEGASFSVGNGVIVETARGNKYGICSMPNRMVPSEHVFLPLKKVIRAANEDDKKMNEENIALADEAFRQCNVKIREHGLEMKLIDAAYTHDREKLIFFFTAPTRVDFRELVKDLASLFKTRIDLRQIGIRDEAKMIGGYGVCGRPLCCCGFLPNFNQVSIKMAKEQNLSLNTSKISGVCGRLMCCLKFEHKTYLDEAKLLPPIGSVVKTADGTGVVVEQSPITGAVKVKPNDGRDAMPKLYAKGEVTVLRRGSDRRDGTGEEEDKAN